MKTVAYYTFIEYLRKKMLYIIFGIGALLMIGTIIAGTLSLNEQAKVIRDFSLGLIEIAGLILVLFFGSNVLQDEISQNTIFLLNSKNIKRSNILLGKFFGFSAVIWLFTIVMGLIYIGITLLYKLPLDGYHFMAILGVGIKLEVLLAICLFFSSFVSPFVALVCSLIIYFLGHILSFVVYYITVLKTGLMNPITTTLLKGIYYIFPNFTSLSVQNFFEVPYMREVIGQSFGTAVGIHIIYIAIVLFFAVRIFNKKQF